MRTCLSRAAGRRVTPTFRRWGTTSAFRTELGPTRPSRRVDGFRVATCRKAFPLNRMRCTAGSGQAEDEDRHCPDRQCSRAGDRGPEIATRRVPDSAEQIGIRHACDAAERQCRALGRVRLRRWRTTRTSDVRRVIPVCKMDARPRRPPASDVTTRRSLVVRGLRRTDVISATPTTITD